jgi:hypothetical protein
MIVYLTTDAPARLGDLERLDRLHAECADPTADIGLADWCTLDADGDHLWLDIDHCRDLGRAELGDDWVARFDGMITYASSKGWTADGRVRAHVEPPMTD